MANVRAKKYFREGKITVKVVDAFSAKQTGTKTIEVNGLAGEAKDGMTVSVKRGNNTTNISDVKAKDTDTLVLTATSRIQDAEYTVTVGEKVATFKGAAEKLTTLKITGENAVVNKENIREATEATVPYDALNQFDEAMDNLSFDVTSSLGTKAIANKGIITVELGAGVAATLIEGQPASVVIVNREAGMSDSATVTVSAKAKIKTVTVEGIYQAEKLPFNDDNSAATFYLILKAEDQYGRVVTTAKGYENDLLFVSSNPLVAELATTPELEEITVDGAKKLGVKITPKTPGTCEVIITPRYFGNAIRHTVTVENGAKIDTITLSQPDGAYEKENLKVPVEAFDVNGNPVTDISRFNVAEMNTSISGTDNATGRFEKDYKTGEIFLNAGKINEGVFAVSIVATTPTYKNTNIVVNVRTTAKPTAITGIKNVDLSVVTGQTITLKRENFIIYDQYDREMADSVIPPNYVVEAVSNDAVKAMMDVDNSAALSGEINNSGANLVASSGAIKTQTQNLVFRLKDKNDTNNAYITGSEYEAKISVVAYADLKSYEIDTVDKVYAPSTTASIRATAHGKAFKVYGKTASGLKVPMPISSYTVATYSAVGYVKITTSSSIATIGGIDLENVDWTDKTNPAETKDITVYITINHDNAALSKTITACEAAPALTTVSAKYGVNASAENTFEVYTSATAASSGAILMKNSLNLKDQYDVDYLKDTQIIVISNLVSADKNRKPVLTNNASNDPKITGLGSGDSYTATITYGGKTFTIKVTVQ